MNEEIATKIILSNAQHERLATYGCPSTSAVRRSAETISDRENIRPAFWHDADRILHSQAYARYIDKTQVFYLFENDHITHRVLHVQLVSKIGRLIARCLRLNEDLVEAIATGHDLGHVPYGHDGEKVLSRICADAGIGTFCHNAQSVRFLMELEKNGKGLNLTLQVLDGILCHNGEELSQQYKPRPSKTWGQFMEEYRRCQQEPGYDRKIMAMTLEGCVMRISDIIAYIGRDIEDAITLGVLKREELPPQVTSVLGDSNPQIVNTLVLDLIEHSYGKAELSFSEPVFEALKRLSEFSKERIYRCPQVHTETEKINRMFEELFKFYVNHVKSGSNKSVVFADFLRNMQPEYLQTTTPERVAVDFIAGMTDRFFNKQYHDLFFPCSYGVRLNSSPAT